MEPTKQPLEIIRDPSYDLGTDETGEWEIHLRPRPEPSSTTPSEDTESSRSEE